MNKYTNRMFILFILIFTILACVILPSTAINTINTIEAAYRDIKIYVDGNIVTPQDASGKIVEPFIYEGTTYLPVRAIGEALGKPVDWDGDNYIVYIGERPDTVITEVTVSTAEQLVNELGSNKRILLEPGVYNLSEVSANHINNTSVYFYEEYDGAELRLNNVHNLTIQGLGDTKSEIVIDPRYAFVMNFQNSSNIVIKNVSAGHTEGGYCSGGVFSFNDCAGILIDETFMYGCGTIGIFLDGVAGITVTNSSIYECTYGITAIYRSSGILFENCVFVDNNGGPMVSASLTAGLVFDSCEFSRNSAQFSRVMFEISLSTGITVTNSVFMENNIERLYEGTGIVLDETNNYIDNIFDSGELE